MKIEIEIPDRYADKNLYLVTRSELVAKRMASYAWEVKKGRCSQCGKCCMEHPANGSYFDLTSEGYCINLKKDGPDRWVCSLGMGKPLACIVGEPEGAEHEHFGCSIRY